MVVNGYKFYSQAYLINSKIIMIPVCQIILLYQLKYLGLLKLIDHGKNLMSNQDDSYYLISALIGGSLGLFK